ncbi:GNAT family N-acetyltransferase [Providencia burhodogranariea]|uniref:GCN5-like N-acetyltransferase n=1 Tax=Providencia burhodogranariea DSM 19968 TaxID=1141662 RepID=K8WQR5_9GAMM|nr:GCN5-like N-acetyltransferase [Providencia burhodogranariea DSM 19968]
MNHQPQTYLHSIDSRYVVTTDPAKMDIIAIHQFLTQSSWAEGIDLDTVELSIRNSLCFGLFAGKQQIGFARIVTDWATFGYLCDVYVLEEWRHKKLSRWLINCCQQHPIVQRLRRIMLVTSSASWLYEKVGFSAVNKDNLVWQIVRPDIYHKKHSN